MVTGLKGVIETKPPELRTATKIQQKTHLQRSCSQVVQYLSIHGRARAWAEPYLNQNPTINHNVGPKSTNYMSAKMDLDWQFSIH